MLTVNDVLDRIGECCTVRGKPLERIEVTKRCPKGIIDWEWHTRSGSGFTQQLLIHPEDWVGIEAEAQKLVGSNKPLLNLWGLPVWITDPPESPKTWLSLRYRNKGVDHSIDVIDEFGNKLGEVSGVRNVDFHAPARGHGYYTIEVRVVDGGLDGP